MSHPARLLSAELEGVRARRIEVEVDLNTGLHSFTIVGLGDKAVGEAKERVNSALKNSGVKPPNRENRKITVNLAPAGVRKGGSHYDFAIALGYLVATGQIAPFETSDKMFAGELALDGRLRPIPGALAIAELARSMNCEYVYLPRENANEASAIGNIKVVAVETLKDALAILEEKVFPEPHRFTETKGTARPTPDFSEIKGQEHAKRALTISAAGGHNILFTGSPGVGKSLLAQALAGILPELTREEAIAVTKVWSAAGMPLQGLVTARPFRAPHQSASAVAIIGGGAEPRPGEISLAHHGVLFLDELPEFPRNVLESLRAPIESAEVRVARAKGTITFPARFTLAAAMNPCPCGYYGDPEQECRCAGHEILRYQKKISGPLLDRIDLQVAVPRVPLRDLRGSQNTMESEAVQNRVRRAREVQRERFQEQGIKAITNSELTAKDAERCALLDAEGETFIRTLEPLRLSPRGFYRLIKTARTIADLEESEGVRVPHLAEALSYRLRNETI